MTDELENELDDELDDLDDPDYDIDRYGDAIKPHYDADRYHGTAGWQPKDEFKALRDKHRKTGEPIITEYQNILEVRTAGGWMKDRAVAVSAPLFGEMWKEGELAILFADTGCGKSIFAVQLAESIARGVGVLAALPTHAAAPAVSKGSHPHEREVAGASSDGVVLSSSLITHHSSLITAKKVLYLDFELTETQFNERYSRHENGLCVDKYKFSRRNMRAQISWNQEVPDAFESYGAFMAHSIAEAVDKHKIKVLIVDNISWLATANTHAGAALTLMKALKSLKQDLGISIMVIAHTPKRPYARPMTDNDLAGNKTLANFADSMIAIGKSHRGHDIRYIKHIKLRNSGSQDDASNVIVCRLEKPHNFPKFTFLEHGSERAHLMPYYDRAYHYREQLTDEARRLAAEGLTERDIADKLCLGKTTVHRYLTEDDRVS